MPLASLPWTSMPPPEFLFLADVLFVVVNFIPITQKIRETKILDEKFDGYRNSGVQRKEQG